MRGELVVGGEDMLQRITTVAYSTSTVQRPCRTRMKKSHHSAQASLFTASFLRGHLQGRRKGLWKAATLSTRSIGGGG